MTTTQAKNRKRARRSLRQKSHIPETVSENLETEEALEEERQQEFIPNKLMKEKLEDEAEKALKRREQANEVEITDFLREQRNRASSMEGNATGQGNAEDTEEEEIELEYVQIHKDYSRKINGRETSPNPTDYEVGDGYVVKEKVTVAPCTMKTMKSLMRGQGR